MPYLWCVREEMIEKLPTLEEKMILVIQQLDRLLNLLEDICLELKKRGKK